MGKGKLAVKATKTTRTKDNTCMLTSKKEGNELRSGFKKWECVFVIAKCICVRWSVFF